MNDFLTEKNKKAGVVGKTEVGSLWLLHALSLGAIGASEKYIGEGRWGMAATEILLCLLFYIRLSGKFRKHYGRKKPGKLPAGLNLMPRIRSHLRNLSRNWEKAQ